MRKLALSQALGQGLLVVITPILTRQYTPGDVGLFQVAFAISIVVALLWTLRADQVLPGHLPGARVAVARRLIGVGVAACVGMGVVAAILALVGWGIAAQIVAMVALLSFSQGLLNLDNAVLSESTYINRVAARNIWGGVLGAGLQVAGGFFLPAALTLAAALAVGRLIAAVATRLGSMDGAIPSDPSIRVFSTIPLRQAVRNVLAGSLGSLTTQLPTLIAQVTLNASAAGFLALSQRVAAAPLSLIGQGLLQSFMISAGALVRERRPGLRALMLRYSTRLVPAGLLLSLILVVVGLTSFEWIFGPGWAPAGQALAILAPAFALQLAASPMVGVYPLVGRGGLLLCIEAVKLAVIAGSCLTGALLAGLSGLAVGAAASILLGHAVTFAGAIIVGSRWDKSVV